MRIPIVLSMLGLSLGCTPTKETESPLGLCDSEGATADCLSPTMSPEYYVEQAHLYFNTMDTAADRDVGPDYSDLVARWEWPPWLKLTGFGEEQMVDGDLLLRLYPSTIPERECLAFDVQPFSRCRVVFYYDDHDGRPCPIYEEFIFNDAGEVTWIEAWSDLPGMLPMADDDTWAEGEGVTRLGTRIPGLGTADGRVDLDGEAMLAAAETDEDVADFLYRANDWQTTWMAEYEAAGDDLWERGCGW